MAQRYKIQGYLNVGVNKSAIAYANWDFESSSFGLVKDDGTANQEVIDDIAIAHQANSFFTPPH